MVLTIPDSLKSITPYIRRSEELEKDSSAPEYKIVAYYCKKYALEQAIKLKLSGPEVSQFVSSVLTILERDKLQLNVNAEQGHIVCENFAHTVFNKADEEDRQGLANKSTAKMFYSAATFFEILEQFGELDTEVVEKRKYSKWKATDILAAIKEGRAPTPGGFEDQQSQQPITQSMPSMSIATNFNQSPPPVYATLSSAPIAPMASITSPVSNSVTIASAPVIYPVQNRPPPTNVTDPRVKDCIEISLFAVAALKQNDIRLAKERLQEALNRLNAM